MWDVVWPRLHAGYFCSRAKTIRKSHLGLPSAKQARSIMNLHHCISQEKYQVKTHGEKQPSTGLDHMATSTALDTSIHPSQHCRHREAVPRGCYNRGGKFSLAREEARERQVTNSISHRFSFVTLDRIKLLLVLANKHSINWKWRVVFRLTELSFIS